jgi:hypothetical protein
MLCWWKAWEWADIELLVPPAGYIKCVCGGVAICMAWSRRGKWVGFVIQAAMQHVKELCWTTFQSGGFRRLRPRGACLGCFRLVCISL